MQHIIVALTLVIFAALPCHAYADLTGQVIHITDGDNLTVVINDEWTRVRLAGIDAPEKSQPFGTRSRQSLSDLCFWKQVTVIPKGKDQYGRMFAKVRCGDVDAGEEQVKRGMAWVYDHYVKDPISIPYRMKPEPPSVDYGLILIRLRHGNGGRCGTSLLLSIKNHIPSDRTDKTPASLQFLTD